MSDPIETYNYDRLGNRTSVEVGADNYDYDYFQDMNRLHRVTKGTDKTEFTYNVFGAVTKIEKFDGQTLTHREEWEYANSTVPKRFTKHNIAEQYSDVEYASPDATSYDAQRWLWQYRKGAFDTREQKRLLISPHGDGTDDNDDDYAHLWEYSLTGVAGELYILYKGLQTATTTEPNENKTDAGRRVYISPFKYYAAGGELQFQADGTTKEVHITDNLGSVRSIVIWDSGGLKDIKGFDYKPFGELDGGGEPTKHGFATAEYDGESSCFAMGMRMYSAELGRFLSVDPLFEAMPRHNPYHYSFNSPLVWKDPSGLAPEKEQDRLMGQYTYDIEVAAELYHGQLVENNYNYMLRWADAVDSFFDLMIDWKNSPEAQGAGGRTGEDGRGENGTKSPDAEAIDAVENKSTNKQADKNSSKGKKGVFSYGDLISLFESNFYKTYEISEIVVEADRYPDLTESFDNHLVNIKNYFKKTQAGIFAWVTWPYNPAVLLFGVIQLKGAKSDFLNLKQTKRYKDGGLYRGEYFEGDDFGNYAYGVAARAHGVHLYEALIGAGAFGIINGSSKDLWNFIGFTDEWKDSKMIIRGFFHSFRMKN